MLALGAIPMPPASTAARSERMSPKRLPASSTSSDRAHAPVPQRVAVAHGVGLGHEREPAAALGSKREGMVGCALDDTPRVDRHLDADVLASARMCHAAGSDVLALGVLPDDDEVDPVGAAHAGRDTGKRD